MKVKLLVLACSMALGATHVAYADDASDFKAKYEALQRQMDALKTQMDQVTAQMQKQKQEPQQQSQAASGGTFIERKPGNDLTFLIGGGEVTLYGHADVSADYVNNGLSSRFGAEGNTGWLTQIASNLSFFGIRGMRPIGSNLNGIFQLLEQ